MLGADCASSVLLKPRSMKTTHQPRTHKPTIPISPNTTPSLARFIVISLGRVQETENSCALLFILPQLSPVTVKGSNILARSSTSSNGSIRMVQHRISVLASHVLKSSRASLWFISKSSIGQVSSRAPKHELPTCSPCSNVMASGESRTSFSTGTTDDSLPEQLF